MITPKDLENLNETIREMIQKHLDQKQITLTEFARKANISQPHLWIFMSGNVEKKGMHTHTVQKIGAYLKKK